MLRLAENARAYLQFYDVLYLDDEDGTPPVTLSMDLADYFGRSTRGGVERERGGGAGKRRS